MRWRAGHPRWLIIGLVFLATTINYLDRQTLSVLAPALIDEFHMSNEAYARVISAFMLAYTVMNGVSGPLIDRLGTRLGYALTMLWWSAAAALHALTRGAWSLGAFRFLLGIGAAGFLWLIVWWMFYYTPAADLRVATEKKPSLMSLLRSRFVWSFTVAKIFIDPVWYFYIFWFPEYLKRARHFDLAAIGKYAWIPFLVAGFGNILGGWVSGILLHRGLSLTVARKSAVTGFTLLMAAAIPAVLVDDARMSVALVSVAMLGYTGVSANMLAIPADVFPGSVVASIWGLASMGSGFGGMVFALATGWVLDRYSYVPVFFGFGLIPLIAAFILWAFLGPLPPAESS